MSNKIYYIFILFLISFSAISQNFSVVGKVVDETDSAAIGAAVEILRVNDSSMVKGITTNVKGFFKLENIAPDNYILKVTYIGYKTYTKNIQLSEDLRVGKIQLKTQANVLKEVEVKTNAVMATQNGDTSAYNANAFKVNKDATAEDLLVKMPGVTSVDGQVQAQGENVKQVLVDGKPFFGDDPNTVLKNLPAEIIDKVQVFDKRSDQSTFSGIDDGNTSKTINIITKTQFRNGVFGKVYGGGGYQDKYKGSAVVNRFKDKQRFTVMALSNNINEQNFSTEDLLGVMSSGTSNQRGGGGSRGGGGGGGGAPTGQGNAANNFQVNIKNGITTTNAFGMNYTDQWGKNTNITASYFFNLTNNNVTSNLLRQYLLGNNTGLNYNENSAAINNNNNHRLSIRFDHKIDSFNSVLIQPKISFQINDGTSGLTGVNTKTTVISNTANNYKSNLIGSSIAIPLLYRHSFAKRGRSLSLDLNPTYTGSSGNSTFFSSNNYFTPPAFSDTVDQKSTITKSGLSSASNLLYNEPLTKTTFLSFNYLFTYNYSESGKNTFNKNNSANDYSIRDSLVSNVFNSTYIAHLGGINYRLQKEKFNFTIGVAAQQAQLNKQQQFPSSSDNTRIFNSVLPNAQFQYRFSKQKNLRVIYRSNNTPPSIDQLQNVLNNSNSLQLSIGNPVLKQTFQHNVNARYSSVNTQKSTSLFILMSASYTDNYIGNSTIIANKDTTVYDKIFLAKGSQISRQENLNNNYNARLFVNYGFPMKALKSNLNLSTGCNYSNVPALINNKFNYSKTTSPSLALVIASNFSDKIDFTISTTSSYNNVINSLQSTLNSSYLNQVSKAKLNLTFFKRLVLQLEYNNTYYSGLTATYNQNINLLNGAVAFKFLKDNQAEFRLYVFDILKQNQSIQRNITETYIEDTHTTILQRYFMLTFAYNIKKYYPKTDVKKDGK